MYDAINDSRVRPSHLAQDGTIRPVHDPFWKAGHTPPRGYRCRCNLITLTEARAQARSGFDKNGQGTELNKVPALEDGSPAMPDTGWDYHPYEDKTGTIPVIFAKYSSKPREVAAEVAEKASATIAPMQALNELEKRQFSAWVDSVLQAAYRPKNEFKRVGVLPGVVLNDPRIAKRKLVNDAIYISDFSLRHGQRPAKNKRRAALTQDDLGRLPDFLESAIWVYDPTHSNVVAYFEIVDAVKIGKAVIQFQYERKGKRYNAVMTTGVIERHNMLDGGKTPMR